METENSQSIQRASWGTAITIVLVGFSCGICNIAQNFISRTSSNPITLPDGSPASPELARQLTQINVLITVIIVLVLLLIASAVFYLFGRAQRPQYAGQRAIALFLGIGSLGCCLWSGVITLAGPATEKFAETLGFPVAPNSYILSVLCCGGLSFFMIVAALAVWFFYIHNAPMDEDFSYEGQNHE